LRKTIETLEEEAHSYEAVLKNNPNAPNIGNIAQRLRTAHRNLAIHRDELAAQIRLLKLELKDAESAAELAAHELQRLEPLVRSGVVAKSKLLKARRDAEAAQLRTDRARTLLELYRKVESPDTRVPDEAHVDDSAARALCDKLRQRLMLIEEAYKAGEASLLEVLTGAKELAKAEVAAANSPEERRNARQRQVDVLKQLTAATEALYQANEAGKADVLAVEVELLKAEAHLKRDSTQSEGNKIIPRWERWEIRFESTDINTYAKQLDYFKIELAAAGGGRKTVDYVSQLSSAKNTHSGTARQEKRLYMSWQDGNQKKLNESLLRQAGVDTENRLVLQFYPVGVEDHLAWIEKENAELLGRTLQEYLKTVFAIRPKGSGWEFFVQEQRFRPKPTEAHE
jgi:arsenate reductase-like glutaredoxin family protein